jgi:hypothetical protein
VTGWPKRTCAGLVTKLRCNSTQAHSWHLLRLASASPSAAMVALKGRDFTPSGADSSSSSTSSHLAVACIHSAAQKATSAHIALALLQPHQFSGSQSGGDERVGEGVETPPEWRPGGRCGRRRAAEARDDAGAAVEQALASVLAPQFSKVRRRTYETHRLRLNSKRRLDCPRSHLLFRHSLTYLNDLYDTRMICHGSHLRTRVKHSVMEPRLQRLLREAIGILEAAKNALARIFFTSFYAYHVYAPSHSIKVYALIASLCACTIVGTAAATANNRQKYRTKVAQLAV